MKRREFLIATGAAALPALGRAADVGGYPNKPVRLVVPFAAGGPVDIVARILGEYMSRELKGPVIVDNRPGAAGNLAAGQVARAEPDGHTLIILSAGMAINATFYKDLNFSMANDFAPVAPLVSVPLVLVMHPGVPASDLRGFLAWLRANPAKANYASVGTGNITHLTAFRLFAATGVTATHVPYKGSVPALQDVVAGNVQCYVSDLPAALPLIREGRVKAIAATAGTRLPDLPDVPTVAESVLPGFDVTSWQGLAAPARTPREIVTRLNSVINAALNDSDVRAKLRSRGTREMPGDVASFQRFFSSEIERWGKVVTDSGAKPD